VNADEIVTPLARTTTARRVAETLRDHILSGRLAPGTPLRETQLSASLGVSRNTLREALRGLAEQGLVTHRPHHGVVVTDLTEDDVADLYRLRSVVELAALPAIATNAEGLERSSTTSASTGRSSQRSAAGASTRRTHGPRPSFGQRCSDLTRCTPIPRRSRTTGGSTTRCGSSVSDGRPSCSIATYGTRRPTSRSSSANGRRRELPVILAPGTS
jgi:DNA-binding transcriptional regulator YhcF (GntR family)